jgi:Family of unknown function (DUF5989)
VALFKKLRRVGRGFGELWRFMRVRKKLWLAPIVIILVAVGALLLVTQGSVLAPFLYTLF